MIKYLANCFILLLPVFAWNILFYSKLPKAYSSSQIWDNISISLHCVETILKALVFLFPLSLELSLHSKNQKIGFALYLVGLLLYFSSWLLQIEAANSNWSKSIWGFLAPAYTSLFWLIGIILMGQKSLFGIPHASLIYSTLSALFVLSHTYHAYCVYSNL